MKTAAAAGLVIGLIFVSGCAVSVDAPTAPVMPSQSSTALSAHDQRRSGSFDVTMGCQSGELVLDVDGQHVLVTQDCKKITISAVQVTLFAEHVDSLIILKDADQATVTVRSVDSVIIDGDQGDVYWEEGTPANVRVRDSQSSAGPVEE